MRSPLCVAFSSGRPRRAVLRRGHPGVGGRHDRRLCVAALPDGRHRYHRRLHARAVRERVDSWSRNSDAPGVRAARLGQHAGTSRGGGGWVALQQSSFGLSTRRLRDIVDATIFQAILGFNVSLFGKLSSLPQAFLFVLFYRIPEYFEPKI